MTNFVFRVRVKPYQEFNLTCQPTPRLAISVQESCSPITKQELNKKKFPPRGFDALCRDKKLIIVCAEDSYYNMETLQITFKNLGLSDYVHFACNGQEAIDMCLQQANKFLPLRKKIVTLAILDQSMPYKTGF